jgi:hypothetical protein
MTQPLFGLAALHVFTNLANTYDKPGKTEDKQSNGEQHQQDMTVDWRTH